VESLLGDATAAREALGWTPEITAREMCAEMVVTDLETARRHALLQAHGYNPKIAKEN
jgi:GDPmannose 4,6-dehydratase